MDATQDIGRMIEYENGDLDEGETLALFQNLIDSGAAWILQGHYGRTAAALIKAGVCTDNQGEDA